LKTRRRRIDTTRGNTLLAEDAALKSRENKKNRERLERKVRGKKVRDKKGENTADENAKQGFNAGRKKPLTIDARVHGKGVHRKPLQFHLRERTGNKNRPGTKHNLLREKKKNGAAKTVKERRRCWKKKLTYSGVGGSGGRMGGGVEL